VKNRKRKKERDPLHLLQIIVIFSPLIPKPASSLLAIGCFLNRGATENANGDYLATTHGGSKNVLFPHILH